jgi:hypothetical protein
VPKLSWKIYEELLILQSLMPLPLFAGTDPHLLTPVTSTKQGHLVQPDVPVLLALP